MIAGGAFYFINQDQKSGNDHSEDQVLTSDISTYVPGVPVTFIDKVLEGPKLDKEWIFPENIKFRVISEDLNGRIRKLRIAVSSPGKAVETMEARAQSELHNLETSVEVAWFIFIPVGLHRFKGSK